MALTLRGDGTGAAFLVNSAWWNDYYNLLTGAMTDQPITVANKVKLTTQNAKFHWNGTLAGTNKPFLDVQPTDASTKNYQWLYTTGNSIALFNATDNKTVFDAPPSGLVSFPNGITSAASITGATLFGMLGTATTGAGVTFKDSAPNIEFDAAANAGTARGLLFAGFDGTNLHQGLVIASNGVVSFTVYDGALATVRTVRVFIGTVDPATYTTVNEGDIWIKV